MTERDKVRDQIRAAIHGGFCGCPFDQDDAQHRMTLDTADAVMAIVDPIAADRDRQRAKFAIADRNSTVLHDEWSNADDEAQALRARVTDLEGQVAAANAKLQHAQTYADNCAKHAAVEVLRGDVAWHLRQIVTRPPHDCADASCSIQIDPCGACCICLGGCVHSGPDEPDADARIWGRGAPQPDGVNHVRERGERHWCLNRTDNLWYMRDISGPMLPWDDLLEGCGWVVEVPPVGQP